MPLVGTSGLVASDWITPPSTGRSELELRAQVSFEFPELLILESHFSSGRIAILADGQVQIVAERF